MRRCQGWDTSVKQLPRESTQGEAEGVPPGAESWEGGGRSSCCDAWPVAVAPSWAAGRGVLCRRPRGAVSGAGSLEVGLREGLLLPPW